MKRPLFAILCMLLLGLSIGSLAAQNSEPPPYLYYYSRMLGGLIIERADGTDSRHIAADVIPPGMTGLAGPGWSPSGRYFAAFQVTYDAYSSSTGKAFVINTRGETVAPLFRHIPTTWRMQWSPTGEDILLILGSHYAASPSTGLGTFLWLIDIENSRLLADFGVNTPLSGVAMSEIIWDVPDEHIEFYFAPDAYDADRYYHVTMQFDGMTLREPVTREEFNVHSTPPEPIAPDYYQASAVSPSGRYKAEGANNTILTDRQTRESIGLPRHSQGTICRTFVWNDHEDYIITLNGTLVAGGGCFAAVLGVTDNQGALWRELGGCSWDFPPCVDWLPERVDVNVLPPGLPTPVQIDPARIDYDERQQVYGTGILEPLTFRLRCGDKLTATIIDINTEEVVYALDDVHCPYTSAHWYAEEGLPIVVTFNPVQDLIATYSEYWETGVSIWQRKGEVYRRVLRLNSQGFALEFKESGEYLQARNVNGWKVYAVNAILERIQPSSQPD